MCVARVGFARRGVLIIFIFITVFSYIVNVVSSEGLYNSSDSVIVLTGKNINTTIYRTRNAWLVEFYNSWCGHCIHYAPTWKALAHATKGWWPVMKLAAIDCNENDNRFICRQFEVFRVPTIMFLDPNSVVAAPKEYKGDRKERRLVHAIIDYIAKQDSQQLGWPNLQPLTKLGDVWNDVTPKTEYVILFIEKDSLSYLGCEVILDMCGDQRVLIRRMLKEDVAKFAISTVPSMYLITNDGMFSRIKSETKRRSFVRALQALVARGVKGAGHPAPTTTTTTTAPTPAALARRPPGGAADGNGDEVNGLHELQPAETDGAGAHVLHMDDLESALYYSLMQEVGGLPSFSTKHLAVLYNYTVVLEKYFPGRPPIMLFLHKLVAWLSAVRAPLTGAEWVASLQRIQTRAAHLPSVVHWVRCVGSSSKYRGYPCGLWTLFHTLTVSALVMHEREGTPPSPAVSQEVLLAMRGYLTEFFTCVECSRNFARGAVHIETRVHTPTDAVIFLWRSHNKANFHLRGTLSEDPRHPKVQFPLPALCAACQRPGGGGAAAPPEWRDDHVIAFLRALYAPQNIVTHVDRHVVRRYDPAGGATGHVANRGSPFTRVDISICLTFYVVGTVVIILVYFHFVVHRHMSLNVCRWTKRPVWTPW